MRAQIDQFIYMLWMVIFLIWAITAFTSKQTTKSRSEGPSRIAVWIVWLAWWLLFTHGFGIEMLAFRVLPITTAASYLGLALTISGLGFSVWARFYLGRNWSGLIQLKEDHKLMRTGPYAIVRHPIYSGFMLATLGTAIAYGELSGFVSFTLILLSWGYKARLEENALLEHFGLEYEDYRRGVKGLIPYIW